VSVAEAAARALLVMGVAAELVCCVGVWWMRDVFDRLHFSAAGTTLGPVLIGVSVVLTGFSSLSGTVQSVAAVVFLLVLNPVLTHSTARAARRLTHRDVRTRAPEDGEEAG
jgi:monovalent cation/proton antiporter MnhG/PhaG subunit